MTNSIPIIDLGLGSSRALDARAEIAQAMADACEQIGFFAVRNHGISIEQPRLLASLVATFFDQRMADKQAYVAPGGFGYIGPEGEQLAASLDDDLVRDYKESLNLRLPVDGESWPEEPVGFRVAGAEYLTAMGQLARHLMSLFATGLDLPAAFFDDKIDRA